MDQLVHKEDAVYKKRDILREQAVCGVNTLFMQSGAKNCRGETTVNLYLHSPQTHLEKEKLKG